MPGSAAAGRMTFTAAAPARATHRVARSADAGRFFEAYARVCL